MDIEAIVIFLLIVFILVHEYFFGGQAPKPYKYRDCMGKQWKNEFPKASKEEIRKFLLIFVNAFAFRDDQRLKFEPNDKIYEIYKSVTGWSGVDAMELETLSDNLEKQYSVSLRQIWHENLTLGELFQSILNAQQGASPDGNSAALHCRR